MFTSRAEHRLLLRQDNTDVRLTPLAHALGMVGDDRLEKVKNKVESAEQLIAYLRKHPVGADPMNPLLADLGSRPITQQTRSLNILARPHVHMQPLAHTDPKHAELLTH